MARGLFSVSNLVKEKEANKNVASLFLKRIEEAIVKLEPEYKPSIYYKPSSLVCLRQMYFTRKGIPPEDEIKDPSFIGICESGSDRHNRIQNVLSHMKDLGMEFEYIDVETYVKEHNLTDIEIKALANLYETIAYIDLVSIRDIILVSLQMVLSSLYLRTNILYLNIKLKQHRSSVKGMKRRSFIELKLLLML